MKTMLTLEEVKSNLPSSEFIEAEFSGLAISIIDYSDFAKLVRKYDSVVFYEALEVDEGDIEAMRFDNDLLSDLPKEYIKSISKEIAEYNQKVVDEEKNIGTLIRIELFTATPVGIFRYVEVNDETNSYDPEEFLEELKDRDALILESYRNRENLERRQKFKSAVEVVTELVRCDPKFVRRTNKELRRKYGNDLYYDNMEKFTELGLSQYHMQDIMEEIWADLKK